MSCFHFPSVGFQVSSCVIHPSCLEKLNCDGVYRKPGGENHKSSPTTKRKRRCCSFRTGNYVSPNLIDYQVTAYLLNSALLTSDFSTWCVFVIRYIKDTFTFCYSHGWVFIAKEICFRWLECHVSHCLALLKKHALKAFITLNHQCGLAL